MRAELFKLWQQEEQNHFEGWDFSAFKSRFWWIENQPWSYMDHAAELMQQATAVLDLDTGGGERLLELRSYWPAKICATESYPPNFRLATQLLTALGVKVVDVASDERIALPFADSEFDLILNRHGGINSHEVGRVLRQGGTFYTQQVHGQNLYDLTEALGAQPEYPDAAPQYYVPRLEAAGLDIIQVQEAHGTLQFVDVSAIVAYLRAVPWVATGFSVDTHRDCLFALQDRVDAGLALIFSTRSYMIEARKS